jgi:hypothetical protein
MASGGTYRIQSSTLNKSFAMPDNTEWTEQGIAPGLNGIPINSGYRNHTWNFQNMDGSDFDDLAALFDEQQSDNAQLVTLETDPYPSDGSCKVYATVEYSDFVILSIDPRVRGLPLYESVSVVFEVFVS